MSDRDKRLMFIGFSTAVLLFTLMGVTIAIFDKNGFNWKPLVIVLIFDAWFVGVWIIWRVAFKKYPNTDKDETVIRN